VIEKKEISNEEEHVSIKHRRDNSMVLSGHTVEHILAKLGMGDRPRQFTSSRDYYDTKHPDEGKSISSATAAASVMVEDTLNMKELVILDTLIFNMVNVRYYDTFTRSEEWMLYFNVKAILDQHISQEKDFEKIRIVGRGGFGMIYACKSCTTGKLYAMKVIDKRRIKLRKAEVSSFFLFLLFDEFKIF
jgi:hypothetical protein